MVYLATLSVAKIIQRLVVGSLMNNNLEGKKNEAVIA
jgi:hypothetical protein